MSQTLWNATDIARAVSGTIQGNENWSVQGICIDSREVKANDLFIALNVARDGHDFVPDALAKGAAGSLVARTDMPGPNIVVKDTQSALENLARAARKRCTATRIAITGSVGKTSLKETLSTLFQTQGRTHTSVKSFNNQWGVPLSLARMAQNSQFGIFEVGTSGPGEIAPLGALIKPRVGIITHIGEAHLAGFGSLQEIAREKASLWANLDHGGIAIFPGDGNAADLLYAQAGYFGVKRTLRFGTSAHCDVQIMDWQSGQEGAHGQFCVLGQTISVHTPVIGMHWAQILAAGMAAAIACEFDIHEIADAMRNIHIPAGRGNMVPLALPSGQAILIDDSYNANPASMKASLDTLARFKAKRKLAVLGQMLELGENSAKLHSELAWPIEQAKLANVYCIGEQMQALYQKLPAQRRGAQSTSIDGMAEHIYANLQDGDVLLIKGSNGSGVHQIASKVRKLAQEHERKN